MALGLERAGFEQLLSIDTDADAIATLRHNRPGWTVANQDVRSLAGGDLAYADLLAAGIPSAPYSIAGNMGQERDGDLLQVTIEIVRRMRPAALIFENVSGLATSRFRDYRTNISSDLQSLGYQVDWRVVKAFEFGVPQLRPRLILVALQTSKFRSFDWPNRNDPEVPTVGDYLGPLMSSRGWRGARAWSIGAQGLAPTIVGGSKSHGGADLGPTRAKRAWLALGVDGRGIADFAPASDDPVALIPRLTNEMIAALQGFPDDWHFEGRKTSVYRQIGNASPPPVFTAIGQAIGAALQSD